MSKKQQQINEIANIMFKRLNGANFDDINDAAVDIYEKGSYRKQEQGEWRFGEKNGQQGWYCTNCFAGFTGENAEWIAKEHAYCPKCGALMK